MKLTQKIRKDKRSFEIVEDGVLVDIQNLNNIQKYKVNFDEIRKDEYINIKRPDPIVILFIFSAVFNAIFFSIIVTEYAQISFENSRWTVFGIFSVLIMVLIGFKEQYQKVYLKSLESNKPLNFIYTKKTTKEVDEFIYQIKAKQKEYLRKKYFKVDPIIPFETQKNRILWLYETELISAIEYEQIMTELENNRLIKGE